MTRQIVVADHATFVSVAGDTLVRLIEEAVGQRGSCSLVLSGGSTPRPVYRSLAAPPLARRIPWDNMGVYFADERCVPPNDDASNYRMVREALLDHVPLRPDAVHRMEAERSDRDAAAGEYEAVLPTSPDVLVLGIGTEGHVASLFPHSPALAERRRVVLVQTPKPPPCRLTITPMVINAAREIVVLVTGAEKAAAVALALGSTGDPRDVPARLARRGTWVLTPEAAGEIGMAP